jgi:hydrogenase maturation protease
MGDDAVGIHVSRQLRKELSPRAGLEFKELGVGGIKLVEEILDYRTVFIIDSIESATTEGNINEYSPGQFNNTYHESSPHDVNFITALELYKKLEPRRVPEKIRIFTIDIKTEFVFKENLTPTIQTAATRLTKLLANEINGDKQTY